MTMLQEGSLVEFIDESAMLSMFGYTLRERRKFPKIGLACRKLRSKEINAWIGPCAKTNEAIFEIKFGRYDVVVFASEVRVIESVNL